MGFFFFVVWGSRKSQGVQRRYLFRVLESVGGPVMQHPLLYIPADSASFPRQAG